MHKRIVKKKLNHPADWIVYFEGSKVTDPVIEACTSGYMVVEKTNPGTWVTTEVRKHGRVEIMYEPTGEVWR